MIRRLYNKDPDIIQQGSGGYSTRISRLLSGFFLLLVLLSASVERCFVYRMQDFWFTNPNIFRGISKICGRKQFVLAPIAECTAAIKGLLLYYGTCTTAINGRLLYSCPVLAKSDSVSVSSMYLPLPYPWLTAISYFFITPNYLYISF